MYSFEYDPLDRLADIRHYLNASPSNSFEEKNISYDLNGNILTMTRVGESGDENEVTYSYSGNQLTSSIYDLNGNITYDVTSGLTMEWNHLDLIKKVSNNSGVLKIIPIFRMVRRSDRWMQVAKDWSTEVL